MSSSGYNKRWYDNDSVCSESVDILENSPTVFQTLIADSVNMIAEREFAVGEMLRSFKSLGAERVLMLHKSKSKRRKQDQNPSVHRTVNYLSLLSPKNQRFMSNKIKQLYFHLLDYVKTCKQLSLPPDEKDLHRIVDVYTSQGDMEVMTFIKGLKTTLYRDIQKAVPLSASDVEETANEKQAAMDMDSERSMRIDTT